MKRVLTMAVFAACAASLISCGGMPGVGGGGGGGYKPDKCFNTQYTGDLTGAKTGQWMTYVMEASGTKITNTVKVVGDGWVEHWMDMGSMAYGYLFQIGADKKIAKAWAAAKGDKKWTEIKVEAPPTGGGGTGEKPEMKESDEKKSVKAGDFNCHKIWTKMAGTETSIWYSKDCWKLYMGSEHGGLVAMESSGQASSKTWLDAKGEDGKPTMDLPK